MNDGRWTLGFIRRQVFVGAAVASAGMVAVVLTTSSGRTLNTIITVPAAMTTIAPPLITWSSDVYHLLALQNSIVLDEGSSTGDVLTREIASDSGFATIIATQSHTLTLGDLSGGAQTGGGAFSWPAFGTPLPSGVPLSMRVRQVHGAQALVSNTDTKMLSAPPDQLSGFPKVSPAFTSGASISGPNLVLSIPKYGNSYLYFSGFAVGDVLTLTFTTSGTTGAPFAVADFLDNPHSYGATKITTGISGAVTWSIDMTVTDSAGRIAPYFDAPGDMTATFTAISFKKKVQ